MAWLNLFFFLASGRSGVEKNNEFPLLASKVVETDYILSNEDSLSGKEVGKTYSYLSPKHIGRQVHVHSLLVQWICLVGYITRMSCDNCAQEALFSLVPIFRTQMNSNCFPRSGNFYFPQVFNFLFVARLLLNLGFCQAFSHNCLPLTIISIVFLQVPNSSYPVQQDRSMGKTHDNRLPVHRQPHNFNPQFHG